MCVFGVYLWLCIKPTGCGKSLVAEILLIRRLHDVASQMTPMKALIVLPYLSMIAERLAYLTKLFANTDIAVQVNMDIFNVEIVVVIVGMLTSSSIPTLSGLD